MTTTQADDLADSFEKGLLNLAKIYEQVRANEEPPRPNPPFENPLKLLEAAWEPRRKLHPIFFWPNLITSEREPSRWQWKKTTQALKAAGFVLQRDGNSDEDHDWWWYEIPSHLYEPYFEAHPDGDGISFTSNRTLERIGRNMNLVIQDACRIFGWAYFKGLVAHPGTPEDE